MNEIPSTFLELKVSVPLLLLIQVPVKSAGKVHDWTDHTKYRVDKRTKFLVASVKREAPAKAMIAK